MESWVQVSSILLGQKTQRVSGFSVALFCCSVCFWRCIWVRYRIFMFFLGSTSLVFLEKQRECQSSLCIIVWDAARSCVAAHGNPTTPRYHFSLKMKGSCMFRWTPEFCFIHFIASLQKKKKRTNIQKRNFLTPNQVIPSYYQTILGNQWWFEQI